MKAKGGKEEKMQEMGFRQMQDPLDIKKEWVQKQEWKASAF